MQIFKDLYLILIIFNHNYFFKLKTKIVFMGIMQSIGNRFEKIFQDEFPDFR